MTSTLSLPVALTLSNNVGGVYYSEWVRPTYSERVGQTYPDWVAEQLEEAKVIAGGEQPAIGAQRSGVDLGDVTVRRPDALAGGAQNGGPGGPADLL